MSRPSRRVGIVLGLCALAGAFAPAPPTEPDPNQALAREQLALVQQALADNDRLYNGGEIGISSSTFDLWLRRKVEATRASGASKAEILKALGEYVERSRKKVDYMKRLFELNQVTRVDLYDAQYQHLEAKMWLNREKSR